MRAAPTSTSATSWAPRRCTTPRGTAKSRSPTYLIEQGADVKARHAEGGSTPLAYAVIKNNVPMVELLLARAPRCG